MTYEKYKDDCKALGFNPTMTLEQFTEMNRAKVPIRKYDELISESNTRRVKARITNYDKLEK